MFSRMCVARVCVVVCARGGIRLALLSYDSLRVCHARHQRVRHVGRLFRTWAVCPLRGRGCPGSE
nr:MAG TPA: hypothetical protein [Caudoviricetes sp.]